LFHTDYEETIPLKFYNCNIAIEDQLDEPLNGASCIIHCAAVVDVRHCVDRDRMRSVNIIGTPAMHHSKLIAFLGKFFCSVSDKILSIIHFLNRYNQRCIQSSPMGRSQINIDKHNGCSNSTWFRFQRCPGRANTTSAEREKVSDGILCIYKSTSGSFSNLFTKSKDA